MSSSSATARSSTTRPISSSSRAVLRTPPSCSFSPHATLTRTGSPTAPTRSGGTTCSTRARRYSPSRTTRTRPFFRRRLGSTTSTSAARSSNTRSATSRWSLEKIARHAIDFWLSTEDLPLPDNRVSVDRDGRLTLSYRPSNEVPQNQLFEKLKSMLGQLGMHQHHLLPRFAYMKNAIPV